MSIMRRARTGWLRWDADGFLARLDLDDPEIQRLGCDYYMGPQDNFMREVAGITLEYLGPGLAFCPDDRTQRAPPCAPDALPPGLEPAVPRR